MVYMRMALLEWSLFREALVKGRGSWTVVCKRFAETHLQSFKIKIKKTHKISFWSSPINFKESFSLWNGSRGISKRTLLYRIWRTYESMAQDGSLFQMVCSTVRIACLYLCFLFMRFLRKKSIQCFWRHSHFLQTHK